uniref:Mitochondrial ribosomal protein S18B n=1 Tax=Oncorhynchus mykiss TaxID=8022 RepID=A0A8C7S0L6_ONCMY
MAASIPGRIRYLTIIFYSASDKRKLGLPLHTYVTDYQITKHDAAVAVETNCYKDRPWGNLESEGMVPRTQTKPVPSTNYRRNQKGGIPPQKTRNTCIVGDTICGNPCPIFFLQNVKLLQNFISPYTGVVYDPTRTGESETEINSNQAIGTARDHELLPFQVPHVDFSGENYSNSHDAVGSAPPPPIMTPWYRWYHTIQPDETEVAQVKKTNEAHLTWTRAYQRNHGEIIFCDIIWAFWK